MYVGLTQNEITSNSVTYYTNIVQSGKIELAIVLLRDGVMVTRCSLEAVFLVRIHVPQHFGKLSASWTSTEKVLQSLWVNLRQFIS